MSSYGEITKKTLWTENPVIRQILGICSALAVTNLVANTLVMGIGVSLVTAFSSLTVSLRNTIPVRVRMMAQTLIIAFYVILVDIVLRAFLPDMSRALGALCRPDHYQLHNNGKMRSLCSDKQASAILSDLASCPDWNIPWF